MKKVLLVCLTFVLGGASFGQEPPAKKKDIKKSTSIEINKNEAKTLKGKEVKPIRKESATRKEVGEKKVMEKKTK